MKKAHLLSALTLALLAASGAYAQQMLVKQYNGYSPVKGYFVNGELTLGENIADNSGAAIAYKAYLLSLGGRPARSAFARPVPRQRNRAQPARLLQRLRRQAGRQDVPGAQRPRYDVVKPAAMSGHF